MPGDCLQPRPRLYKLAGPHSFHRRGTRAAREQILPMQNDPHHVEPLHVDHHPATVSRNARAGLWLFAVYLVLYGGFMALSAFFPQKMSAAPFGGINLAVMYGLVLILGAFVLALVYMFLVRRRADDVGEAGGETGTEAGAPGATARHDTGGEA